MEKKTQNFYVFYSKSRAVNVNVLVNVYILLKSENAIAVSVTSGATEKPLSQYITFKTLTTAFAMSVCLLCPAG